MFYTLFWIILTIIGICILARIFFNFKKFNESLSPNEKSQTKENEKIEKIQTKEQVIAIKINKKNKKQIL